MENKEKIAKVELNDEHLEKVAGGYFATEDDETKINELYNNLVEKNPDAKQAIDGFYDIAKSSGKPITYEYVYSLVASIPGIIL